MLWSVASDGSASWLQRSLSNTVKPTSVALWHESQGRIIEDFSKQSAVTDSQETFEEILKIVFLDVLTTSSAVMQCYYHFSF